MATQQFLSPRELAERWRVSRFTIVRMIKGGTLRGSMIGSRWRVELRDVERYERAARRKEVQPCEPE